MHIQIITFVVKVRVLFAAYIFFSGGGQIFKRGAVTSKTFPFQGRVLCCGSKTSGYKKRFGKNLAPFFFRKREKKYFLRIFSPRIISSLPKVDPNRGPKNFLSDLTQQQRSSGLDKKRIFLRANFVLNAKIPA